MQVNNRYKQIIFYRYLYVKKSINQDPRRVVLSTKYIVKKQPIIKYIIVCTLLEATTRWRLTEFLTGDEKSVTILRTCKL